MTGKRGGGVGEETAVVGWFGWDERDGVPETCRPKAATVTYRRTRRDRTDDSRTSFRPDQNWRGFPEGVVNHELARGE